MTSTGRSNNDVIAEAVAAIGQYQTWISTKRVEIQGQIAQMQAASATTATTNGSLASRFQQLGVPHRNGSVGADTNLTTMPDTTSAHATAPEAAGEPGSPTPPTLAATPALEDAPTTTAALPPLQNQQEAQTYLERVFTATPLHTLPPRVIAAWEGRTADASYTARMLIGAKEAGVLSADLAHAVSAMVAFDNEFAAAYALYEGGYKELFDIGLGGSGPTDDEAEEDEDADQEQQGEEGDTAEEEGNELEETDEYEHYGFPGDDQHERPF